VAGEASSEGGEPEWWPAIFGKGAFQREENRRATHIAAPFEHRVRFGQAVLRQQGIDRSEYIASTSMTDDVVRR
jgi:hypothetical protein